MKTAEGVARSRRSPTTVADLVLEVRRRAVGRARRRPGARPVHREDVRPGALPGVPDRQAHVRSATASSTPARSSTRPPLTANLRYGAGYQTPDPPTYFDYAEYGGFGRAVEMCSGARRLPQDARRDDVPVVHGDARREALDARPREHAAAGHGRPARRSRARRRRRATRCSTSASSAARARPSAPSASTSRASRASFSPSYWRRHGMPLRRARDRPRAHAVEDRQPLRAAVEHRRAQRPSGAG